MSVMIINNNFRAFHFGIQLQDFYNYIDTMEGSIDSHISSLDSRFEEKSKDITDPKIKEEFYDSYFSNRYYDLDTTYTLILRKSIFFSLYFFMESELQAVAKTIEKKNLTNIKLNDIRHNGFRKYLFYIKTVNNININFSENDINKFHKYNDLRNYFVHNDSTAIDPKKYNNLKTLPSLSFTKYSLNEVTKYLIDEIEKDFNKEYLDLISRFFDKLFEGIEDSDVSL